MKRLKNIARVMFLSPIFGFIGIVLIVVDLIILAVAGSTGNLIDSVVETQTCQIGSKQFTPDGKVYVMMDCNGDKYRAQLQNENKTVVCEIYFSRLFNTRDIKECHEK